VEGVYARRDVWGRAVCGSSFGIYDYFLWKSYQSVTSHPDGGLSSQQAVTDWAEITQ
jgi:hypothetical protein